MTQGEPAGAAGACGSRISRQSACASGAIRELSWAGSGVATGPSGPVCRRRPQIVLALVIGRQVAAEAGGLRDPLEVAAAGQPGDQRHQEQEGADIGRDRIAGHAQHMHGAEPPMHHRPARAQRHPPERQVEPFRARAPAAPGRARRRRRRRWSPAHRRPSRARAARRRRCPRSGRGRCRDRSLRRRRCAPARSAQSRWNRRSRPGRASSPAPPARRRCRARPLWAGGGRAALAWFMAAASITSRSLRRRPLRSSTWPWRKSMPSAAHVAALGGRLLDGDLVAVARGDFLDHHGVAARRHHAAGEDARGLACFDLAVEGMAGGHFADQL